VGKAFLIGGTPYAANRQIGFSTSGEHYADDFNLFSLRFWLPGFAPAKKRGRPKDSKDSRPRFRSCQSRFKP
jgi:hypothetical protein